MATLTLAPPLCRPILLGATPICGGATLLPAIYLAGKSLPSFYHHKKPLPFTTRVAFNPPKNFPTLSLHSRKPYLVKQVSSSLSYIPFETPIPASDSTRKLALIFSIAVSITNHLIEAIQPLLSKIASTLPNPSTVGPVAVHILTKVFSAAINEFYFFRPMVTPLTPVVLAISKFLNIYCVVLSIRTLSVPFNPPWEKWPFSTIKDMADPYLYLFQKHILPLKINDEFFDLSYFYGTTLLDILIVILTVSNPNFSGY